MNIIFYLDSIVAPLMLKNMFWLFHESPLLLTYLANLLKYLLLYVEKYDRFDVIDNMRK